jgi:uncharacterized protein
MTTSAEPRAVDDAAAAAPRARRRRWWLWTLVVLVTFVAVALLGIGWYYADEILVVPEATAVEGDVAVGQVDPTAGTVELASTPASTQPGVWGLQGDDWYARVGEIVAEGAGTVTRSFEPLPDEPSEGDLASIDGYAYPTDPDGALPFPVERVTVPGPLGDYPAIHVPGESATWAIFVHGRGARISEGFRALPTAVEAGLPALVVSYRNDADAPAAPDGRYGLGWTEWEDVHAAVDWAAERGAAEVVLFGYSMGGAIVGNLERQGTAVPVRAMVLDAPVVDWGLTLDTAARGRGVPTALTPLAQAVVTLRAGIRWGQLSLLERAEDLDVPILLFHGDADDTVPVEGSDALAEARPDLVTYVRVPDANHVQAWNADPDAYAAALRSFLAEVGVTR